MVILRIGSHNNGFHATVVGMLTTIHGLLLSILYYAKQIYTNQQIFHNQELKQMAADKAALDVAIAQESIDVQNVATGISTLATADQTAFADLLAKIAANPGTPVDDFTDEITSLSTNHTTLTNAATALASSLTLTQGDDPGSQTSNPVTGDQTSV